MHPHVDLPGSPEPSCRAWIAWIPLTIASRSGESAWLLGRPVFRTRTAREVVRAVIHPFPPDGPSIPTSTDNGGGRARGDPHDSVVVSELDLHTDSPGDHGAGRGRDVIVRLGARLSGEKDG